MKRIYLTLLIFTLILASCNVKQTAPVRLSQLFSDHMIIQRDHAIHVFGSATPGIKINAEIAGNKSIAKADKNGKFNITLPQLKAGGPYELIVSNADTLITIKDVLVGDIWICSGQSNMEFTLVKSDNGANAIDSAKYNQIRILEISHDLELVPLDTFRNKIKWKCADVDPIFDFSAIGYYFGVELYKKLNIPIGLIGSNWGGTNSETWTQTQALDSIAGYKDKIDFVKNAKSLVTDINEEGKADFYKWRDSLYKKGVGMAQKWYLPSTNSSDWEKINVPGSWEEQIPELKTFDGVVWYRKEFDIPTDFLNKDLKIWLSTIRDYDIAWLNGEQIGETYSPFSWRGYTAPASIVKAKKNVLIVRVYNRKGNGGFQGMKAYFDLYPTSSKKQVMSTAGKWSYKIAAEIQDTLSFPISSEDMGPNNFPSLLYNTMINPMIKFPIKGAIWYQGEANADRAYQYRQAFPAMIKNWRQQWGIGDFPFYFVQLANFGPENDKLGDSFWAELREAQALTLSLPNTGMATAIDKGNPINIHPTDKTTIGKRLAANAFNYAYGIITMCSGPTYSKFTVNNSEVTIEFTNLGSGLVTKDDKTPKEFLIAGKDMVFYNADAKIVDNKIVVSSAKVKEPVAVRYAWKNSPAVNLYNKEGFPALPFRTDNWEGVTANNFAL